MLEPVICNPQCNPPQKKNKYLAVLGQRGMTLHLLHSLNALGHTVFDNCLGHYSVTQASKVGEHCVLHLTLARMTAITRKKHFS